MLIVDFYLLRNICTEAGFNLHPIDREIETNFYADIKEERKSTIKVT
jgi:hypothetical protein